MKRKVGWLVVLGCLFSPLPVFAASASVNLACPATAKAGENISCTISANTSGDINGINAHYYFGDGTSYQSFNFPSNGFNYQISQTSSSGFVLGHTSGLPANFVIGNLIVYIPSSAAPNSTVAIGLRDLGASDMSYNDVSVADTTTTVRIASNVSTLQSLQVSGANFSFSPTVTNYHLTVNAAETNITATATDQRASISSLGHKTLSYGQNNFTIVVTAEDGSKTTYSIEITRPDNRSSNNNLAALQVSNANLNFSANITNYQVEVANNVSSVTISAQLADSKASFAPGFGPRTVTLNYGANNIVIRVQNEKGETKDYNINIVRKDDRSSNNNLKSLTISDIDLDFSKNRVIYEVSVSNEIEVVTIAATAEDSKSKIEGLGEKSLNVGRNVFTIQVAAENGSVKTYQITIIRDEKVTETAANSIKDLIIEGHDISFTPDKKEYTITTTEKQLNIQVELADETSTYVIDGNENLTDGSIIKITVTDSQNNKNVYTIHIENPAAVEEIESSTDKPSSLLIIIAIIIFLIGLAAFILAMIRYRKIKHQKNLKSKD